MVYTLQEKGCINSKKLTLKTQTHCVSIILLKTHFC